MTEEEGRNSLWCVNFDNVTFRCLTLMMKIPTLLLRIRALFRIYYNWQVTEERTADLKYCDFDDVGDVSIPLHELGLTLQLDRRRLKAVIDAGGAEFERVVLDMAPDIGPWREAAMNYEDELRKSEEADDGDRDDAQDLQDKADEDLAAYATVWFYGDLHVAFIMGTPTTEDEKRRAKKALKRLVFWSCNKKMRLIFGDCLTDSMRSIYGTPELLVKFCQVGGLAALIGDCVRYSDTGLRVTTELNCPYRTTALVRDYARTLRCRCPTLHGTDKRSDHCSTRRNPFRN